MTISDKTRKILWGRSGNRCAICRRELVMDANNGLDDEAVIGDECHIVARELDGPRGDSPLTADERDSYDNLILLCKNHHKLIDDQPNNYSVEILQVIKLGHEKWVRETLKIGPKTSRKKREPFIALRIETGQQLFQKVGGSFGYLFNNDNLENEYEVELVGDFLQSLQDYLDIWDELESKHRIQAQFRMGQDIQNLEANGFLVYGCNRREKIKAGNNIEDWPMTYVFVLRKSNPIVARKDEQVENLFGVGEYSSNEFSGFVLVKPG